MSVNLQKLFERKSVREMLIKMAGCQLNKVFKPTWVDRADEMAGRSKFELLTDQEVKQKSEEMHKKARVLLQMPPVMKPRKPCQVVLKKDDRIKMFSDTKFVFTDITLGMDSRKRPIVVRETDGTLRTASWDERDRLTQTYFPQKARFLKTPKMFHPENLTKLLDANQYEYILDRALYQFEPDNPEFTRVTHLIYERINLVRNFDHLRSTRHFGSMVLYLVGQGKIDFLLLDFLERKLVEDGANLIKIFHAAHPKTTSARHSSERGDAIIDKELISLYVEQQSTEKEALKAAFNIAYGIEDIIESFREG